MIKSVHQILPTLSLNDAIGNESLEIQKILQDMGFDSKIYVENAHQNLKKLSHSFTKYDSKNSTQELFIYHHSIGSNKIFDFVKSLDSKKILIYHNITPPDFFRGISEQMVQLLKLGIEQLSLLKNYVDLAVGDSEYNKLELDMLGFKKTGVLPILLDQLKYNIKPKKNIIKKYQNSKNILYVGRFAPNKQVDKIIKSFYYYNSNINSNSNLFLVGPSPDITKQYQSSLESMIEKTHINNVHFIYDASDEDLLSYYTLADLFLLLSKHEGFGVPLIESMLFNVPIIAYNSSAIPYILKESGILVKDETFEEIGEQIDLLLSDETKTSEIIKKQKSQLQKLYSKSNSEFISDLLNAVS